MKTNELNHLKSLDPDQQRVALAVGIIVDRMRRLSQEDSDVMLALLKDYRTAETNEDRNAADAAIMELLEQPAVQVLRLRLVDASESTEKLDAWKKWAGEQVRVMREKAGMTQQDLAKKSGLPQSHISRVETAKHSPSRATLEKIAAALGVSVKTFDPSADD